MITEKNVKEIIESNFKNFLHPLNQISRDTENEISMINRPNRFHNYDSIARKLYKESTKPKTPDMILFKNNTIIFVEFKNGKVDKDEIKLKAIEGGFIILHRLVSLYCPEGISDIEFMDIVRLRKYYILVYNEKKVDINGQIRNSVENYLIQCGLAKYKKTFFEEIELCTISGFEKWLDELGFTGYPEMK